MSSQPSSFRLSFACWWCLLGVLPTAARSADEVDSADRNYGDQLPRIAPVAPGDALATFRVAAGFRLEQAACEPLVVDPVAVAFDENGRLYVVEMRDYSEDDTLNLGRIRLLDDADGDGRLDASRVFAEGLSWPTGVICFDGGIFVAAAPHIYYFKDTDGDDRADVRRIVFTGFGRSNVQGLLNTLTWGLDSRIHGAASSSGGEVVATDEQGQSLPGAQPVVLRGRDFAFDPRTLKLESTSGGAQHGLSFNPWGDKFVCSNSNHFQFVTYEDRYVARNPFLAAAAPRVDVAEDGPQADVFRSSPVEPWRIVRTRLRAKKIVPGVVEGGGRPAGYFTGATGVTIFRGDAWPRDFVGWAIVGDVGSNLVHRKRVDRNGVSFVGRRVDEQSDFVTSTDIWFRPVQFANAPDGSLFICDMYREVIEHPASLPPIIKQHLDLTSGRDRGRLYRVVGDDFQRPPPPRLGAASAVELARELASPNGWRRETAARLLYERQDARATAALASLAKRAELPESRIAAVYALSGLAALSPETLAAAAGDADYRVRRHALRLMEPLLADSASLGELVYAATHDSDDAVQYQAAFTLGELPASTRRNEALADLVLRHSTDPLFRTAILSSLSQGAGGVLLALSRAGEFRGSAAGKQWLPLLAAQIGRQRAADDVAALIQTLRDLRKSDPAAMQLIVASLGVKPTDSLAQQVAAATGGESERLLAELISQAAVAARDAQQALPARVEAVRRLRLGEFALHRELFAELLAPAAPLELQTAAVTTLATFTAPEVGEWLVSRWSGLSPQLRSRVADALLSREAWLPALFAAVAEQRIAAADLPRAQLQSLTGHRNEQVRAAARAVMADLGLGSRAEVLAQYRSALELAGDAARGKAIFQQHCSVCHKLAGSGHEIGPNLAAMRNRGAEAILTNVLAPNQEVNPQYVNYVVVTGDGRQLTGIIAGESASSLTLRRAENQTDTILRVDIEELRGTGVSLMPEGLEKQIDPQGIADLIQYILTVD